MHSHCSSLREIELRVILQEDRAFREYRSFRGKMVLKRLFISDTGKTSLCSLFRSWWGRAFSHCPGRWSFEAFSQEIEFRAIVAGDKALNQYDSLVENSLEKAICQWHFVVSSLHVYCSDFMETDLWAILPIHRAWNWYDTFSGKMTLKMLFIGATGKASSLNIHFSDIGGRVWAILPGQCFKFLVSSWSWKGSFVLVSGRQNFKPFSQEMQLWVDMIVLVTWWSWRGHILVTLWKPWLSKFIAQVLGRLGFEQFSQETELWVDTIVLSRIWA